MKNRWAAATALAAALILGTTGCTFSAEIATQKDYDPSDGVSTEFGELSVYNAMLIGEDPEALNLVMTVFNPTDSVRRVEGQWFVDGVGLRRGFRPHLGRGARPARPHRHRSRHRHRRARTAVLQYEHGVGERAARADPSW